VLLESSEDEFARIMVQMDKAGSNEYDVENINQLYLDSALVLPHRPYDVVSRERANESIAFSCPLNDR